MTISDITSGGHLKARLKSLETRSCQLTARHGVQLFADVEVTLHVALERNVGPYIIPLEIQSFQMRTVKGHELAFPKSSDKRSPWQMIPSSGPEPRGGSKK